MLFSSAFCILRLKVKQVSYRVARKRTNASKLNIRGTFLGQF